ncbi:hypothetical protein SLS62_007666 [Diatrype stigma]|uniref:MOSC domain-containing protein n=1 Tax=Diatrype stigma TaxID=117547 RepID=A0AAN9UNG2_9PEZI
MAASAEAAAGLSLSDLNLDYESIWVLLVTVAAFLIPVVLVFPPFPPQKSDALLQTHSKAGVGRSESNIRLGARDKPSAASATSADRPPRVRSLVVYPVKSCRGIEVRQGRVLPAGLEFDRIYTFAQLRSRFPVAVEDVDDEKKDGDKGNGDTWDFITQRQFPRLATVKVDLWLPDEAKLRRQGIDHPASDEDAFLILRFPWRDRGWRGALQALGAKLARRSLGAEAEREVLLPVAFSPAAEIAAKGYAYEDVRIWKDTVSALNVEAELPPELRLYLGVSNRLGLFRVDPARLREVYRCAPRRADAGYQPVTGFQDAYPLHILNLPSLRDFSSQVPKDQELQDLDVLRFRPNIIVSGAPAYDEETWKQIRLKPGDSGLFSDAVFHVSCRTVRCKMPNVNQTTGLRHPVEPDKSLRTLRAVDEGAPRMGCLGMQLTPLFGSSGAGGEEVDEEERTSWVGVGMEVVVEERGEHVYIKQ